LAANLTEKVYERRVKDVSDRSDFAGGRDTAVTGGMMKLPTVVPATTVKTDYGWTWGTVSDLPASAGVGIVIRF
jgi:hypothetical protein